LTDGWTDRQTHTETEKDRQRVIHSESPEDDYCDWCGVIIAFIAWVSAMGAA